MLSYSYYYLTFQISYKWQSIQVHLMTLHDLFIGSEIALLTQSKHVVEHTIILVHMNLKDVHKISV